MSALQVASACLCLSVAAAIGASDPPARLPTTEDSTNCILETKITLDEIRNMQYSFGLTTKSQFCMVSCIWKKANVITEDGRFLPENAMEFIRLQFGVVDNNSNFLKTAINQCLKDVSDRSSPGECFLGGLMYKCLMTVNGKIVMCSDGLTLLAIHKDVPLSPEELLNDLAKKSRKLDFVLGYCIK